MIDLQAFCQSDDDFIVHCDRTTPWSFGAYSYATDGIIGIRVARRDGITREDGPDLEGLIQSTPEEGALIPLPVFTLPPGVDCGVCDGLGYLESCAECSGMGETECTSCGHDAECEECDGSGHLSAFDVNKGVARIEATHERAVPCDDCEGSGKIAARRNLSVEIALGTYIDAVHLDRLRALPNVRIDTPQNKKFSPIRFAFDGGIGLIMPLSRSADGECIAVAHEAVPSREIVER